MTKENGGSSYEGFVPKINEVAQKFLDDLKREQERLSADFPTCAILIEDAIDRIYATGRIPGKELKADVFQQKPIKLTQNVFLPVKQYPKFNFQGKILGPKGNTLKRLHEDTMCSISIKGRNSLRDQDKEESLRQSGNPAYNHLNKNLYVEMATVAAPAEAHARMAYALTEIRKYIIPDKNDEISQEQYRELMEIDPKLAKGKYSNNAQKSVLQKITLKGTADDDSDMLEDESQNSPITKNAVSPIKRPEQQTTPAGKLKNLRPQPYQRSTPIKAK